MADVLMIDTCVLPRSGDIKRNPLMSALLKVAEVRGMRVILTDVVLEEALHQRLQAAREASAALQAALGKAARVYSGDTLQYYIPDPMEAVDALESQLRSLFEIWETHGDDARSALLREARRRAPARPTADGSARGGRDASIWLSAVRIAGEESVDSVYFTSSNTKDFAKRDGGLSDELAKEIDGALNVQLATSLESAVSLLAEVVTTEPVDDDLITLVMERYPAVEQAVSEYAREILDADSVEEVAPISVAVSLASERHAFRVGDARLSDVTVHIECSVGDAADEATTTVALAVDLWVQSGPDGYVVEIENVYRRR